MKKGCLIFTCGFIILLFLLFSNIQTNNDYISDGKILAFNYAIGFVKDQLKSSSNAKFPESQEKYDSVILLGNGEYEINSWVESPNSFGVMIRNKFSCKIIMDGDKVKCENLKITP